MSMSAFMDKSTKHEHYYQQDNPREDADPDFRLVIVLGLGDVVLASVHR
jgi:hypothetical protein